MSLLSKINSVSQLAAMFIAPIANLAGRLYVGWEFFKSGLLKLEDWDDTLEMFEDDWAIDFLPTQLSALLGTAGELVLPVLLFLGLFTRFGAAGLFVMVLVIECFIYPVTQQHYYWMIILGMLVGYGGDKISVDNLLLKRS